MKPIRILLLYGSSAVNSTFSYQQGWPEAFRNHPRFQPTAINLLDRRFVARAGAAAAVARWRGDAVVLLHSVFSNARLLSGRLFDLVRRLPQPKTYFIGNEYKLMPEKMTFSDELGISLLVSQTRSPRVHRLYHERLGCPVIGIPNTGFDPAVFRPMTAFSERPIDLGYRADEPAPYIGHTERRDIADFFRDHAGRLQLRVDISLDPRCRLAGADWARFLDRCKGQLGTEAGGDFFELTDKTRNAVNDYSASHPDAPFSEIRHRFFSNYENPVPIRIISGRNVEAAATKTIQILFAGEYDGYLRPDEHYIPLQKDFSNVDDAMAKFRNRAYCERVTTKAYDLAMSEFTYDRLIDNFTGALEATL